METIDIHQLNETVAQEAVFLQDLLTEVNKVIVGQEKLIERLLIGLLADGHVLLEGVPGLAKTLAVSTLSQAVQAKFQRIQFTPDLLPADVIGTEVYNPRTNEFTSHQGPIFANFILADEINRAPAKVQSALLEAMQERQVTIGNETYKLEKPFLVLATQNPIEQEGTYPLPEAQVDRFMLKVVVTYPTRDEERLIMDRMTGLALPTIAAVTTPEQLMRAREVVRKIYVDEKIKNYVLDIIFATRNPVENGLTDLAHLIDFGASPRATIYMIMAARAHAFLQGRGYVSPEDIKSIALDILRHRVVISYEAEAEEISSEEVVRRILERIEVP
ncbi:MoxR family ATPase [Anaerolineales bacterium HSG6]|nr:MoxR family ATPase [Anaerolineales bacterium HSG6]